MADKYRVKWSREETILAFELYCRTPFSKINKNNKDIKALASLLGRTPSSVGLKMANLAHFDTELQTRKVSGMAHGSKLDAQIWKEFLGNWEELSYQAKLIMADLQHVQIDSILEITDIDMIPVGEYREKLIKTRVGQYFFRMSVLNAYENKCCVTGLMKSEILVASHIKPWKDSDSKTERTNPSNGLCLNSLHDKAFDRGLITIDKKYNIILSKQIRNVDMDTNTKIWFESYNKKQIILPDKFLPGKDFIEYHNDVIFLG